MVSTPSGVSNTSQQGGGSTPAGHLCWVPMIHPRRCSTMKSGEVKTWLETTRVLSQNNCGALNGAEGEIKARGRKVGPKRLKANPCEFGTAAVNRCATQNHGCERILTNCACLRGTKGEAAIWPSNFFDHRPGSGVWQAGQLPSGVSLYFSIKYP